MTLHEPSLNQSDLPPSRSRIDAKRKAISNILANEEEPTIRAQVRNQYKSPIVRISRRKVSRSNLTSSDSSGPPTPHISSNLSNKFQGSLYFLNYCNDVKLRNEDIHELNRQENNLDVISSSIDNIIKNATNTNAQLQKQNEILASSQDTENRLDKLVKRVQNGWQRNSE